VKFTTVILAAGQSKRMSSLTSKLLFKISGKYIIEHVLDTVHDIKPSNIICVLNKTSPDLEDFISNYNVKKSFQNKSNGTAKALEVAITSKKLESNNTILVLCGDVPFIKSKTLKDILRKMTKNDLCLGTITMDNPYGYGRILRLDKKIVNIVEERDANKDIKKIKEINTGIIAIKEGVLRKYLKQIKNNNNQKEYYLTDLINLFSRNGLKVTSHSIHDTVEVMGINSKKDLAELERKNILKKAQNLVKKGTLIRDINRIDIRGTLTVKKDVDIDVNCIFEDNVSIGSNTIIGHNCYLNRCKIGNNVNIKPNTIIFGSSIGDNSTVGPYARIRAGTMIKKDAQIGNFVEIKNSVIGSGTKINHLSYIGDAELGNNINIGAGTITCNYDGHKKHKTIIESNAFIGSGTKLVAPIKVTKGTYVGAGSTITKDTVPGKLTLARSRQITIDKWKSKPKAGKK
tara:strand:+ start:287 stop:1660 length:1374 start_codon:yes stop_codon:yes gene_type:complete